MEKVCAIIDFEGFEISGGHFLVREFSFAAVDDDLSRCFHFDLTAYEWTPTDEDWRTIAYVENKICGLKFSPSADETVYPLDELDHMLREMHETLRKPSADVVGYKGGHYEQDRLAPLGIPSINLEKFGCPKFKRLNSAGEFNMTCGAHFITKNIHCSLAEVIAFRAWLRNKLMRD